MSSQAKVSVLVPIYNVEKFIERCARSLFEQTLDNIEYIFVNDCTPDNSMTILRNVLAEYPNRIPQVQIIEHEKNKGLNGARTTGIKNATGEYVIHCDSDDWVETDMYEIMYNTAVCKNADMVCCSIYFEQLEKRILGIYDPTFNNKDSIKHFQIEGIYSSLWNKLVKRNLYIEHDIMPYENINMWEDIGITLRLRFFSKKIEVVNKPLYHYLVAQNVNSICANQSAHTVNQQIICAGYLEQFFKEQDAYEEFIVIIQNLKFRAKDAFFLNAKGENIKLWKTTYPETHKFIWKFNLPFNLKLIYWLAAHNMTSMASFLLIVRKYTRKMLHR